MRSSSQTVCMYEGPLVPGSELQEKMWLATLRSWWLRRWPQIFCQNDFTCIHTKQPRFHVAVCQYYCASCIQRSPGFSLLFSVLVCVCFILGFFALAKFAFVDLDKTGIFSFISLNNLMRMLSVGEMVTVQYINHGNLQLDTFLEII